MDIEKIVERLAGPDFEGYADWPYCDSRGLVTVGIGNMLPSPEACAGLPFHHLGSGEDATDEEKSAGWTTVLNHFTKGASANAYRPLTTLRLTRDVVYSLATRRIQEDFIPALRKRFPDFDNYPDQVQDALVDMDYNLGDGKLGSAFDGPGCVFGPAVRRQDWATCAEQCHRSTCRDSRNAWTAAMFRAAIAAESPA